MKRKRRARFTVGYAEYITMGMLRRMHRDALKAIRRNKI